MKKITAIILSPSLVFSLAACGINNEETVSPGDPTQNGQPAISETSDSDEERSGAEESTPSSESAQQGRVLVAYFSWADNAVMEGEVDAVASSSVVAPGNVQQLAGWVQEQTGGDLFSIQVTEPYPSDWDECLARANEERAENARPALTETVETISDYDVVFLGYPNWWYGAPMALLSFIEQNDLSGKQIYLFCSHGTGGLAGSVDEIASALPESAVLSENVFDVYEEDAASSENDILSWLGEVGY